MIDSLQNVEGWRQVLVQVARVALVLQLSFSQPIGFSVTRGVINAHLPSLVPHMCMWFHVLVTAVIVGSAVGVASINLGIDVGIGITSSVSASFTTSTCSPPRWRSQTSVTSLPGGSYLPRWPASLVWSCSSQGCTLTSPRAEHARNGVRSLERGRNCLRGL